MPSRATVAVIGTAGRGPAAALMSRELFDAMIARADGVITSTWGLAWDRICLVSGGAAWADHVAVRLFRAHPAAHLCLHLPCPLLANGDADGGPSFLDRGSGSWRENPGHTANKYHRHFSQALGVNTLAEIADAVRQGAVIGTADGGYHARNDQVAVADYLLAMTWSEGDAPTAGGTLYTWNKAKGTRLHIPLSTLSQVTTVAPIVAEQGPHGEGSSATSVAIVGSAGRGDVASLMSSALFDAMIAHAEDVITSSWSVTWDRVCLVSGGAAWADHVAIRLFRSHPTARLVLHFPCPFISDGEGSPRFQDLGSRSWHDNPGPTANKYHLQFSNALGIDSLAEIADAIRAGAVVATTEGGFRTRNTEVARADYLLAYTWAGGDTPGTSGTLDTWNKSSGVRLHVSLSTLTAL